MNQLLFENRNSLVRSSDFDKAKRKAVTAVNKIKEEPKKKYDTDYASIYLPDPGY